ncbi:hypothetical protein BDZ45DRAFT_329856 [Acephala macrosclerotiorum]|nr:hypothetical protein BDZ45DRAFT_329856 [Acephala macrosclerotiorum]
MFLFFSINYYYTQFLLYLSNFKMIYFYNCLFFIIIVASLIGLHFCPFLSG